MERLTILCALRLLCDIVHSTSSMMLHRDENTLNSTENPFWIHAITGVLVPYLIPSDKLSFFKIGHSLTVAETSNILDFEWHIKQEAHNVWVW